ncbi:MAG: hypothetical protein AAGA84_11905 [Pseudomonadota bacterium]
MSHFEYVAVMMSIIMGLGIIRLLSSLDSVFSKDRYWPHALWVFSLFWLHVQNWWGLWELRQVTFNVLIYSVLICYASVLYLSAVALTNRSGDDVSWKTHFYAQRRWFFGALFLVVLIGTLMTRFLLGASLLHPYRLIQFSCLAMAALAFFRSHELTQKIISVLFLVLMMFGISLFRFMPDLFGAR